MSNRRQLRKMVGDYFCRVHKLDPEKCYDIVASEPYSFLCSNRIDLVPKLKWIESHETNKGTVYYTQLYREHIKAITGRTCVEGGQEENKNSLDEFENVFSSLLSIRDSGINPDISVIPVGNNGIIMDGAHRTATSIYFNKTIPCVKLEIPAPCTDASFFIENLMDVKLVESMISDYCNMTHKRIYAICLWPKSGNPELRNTVDQLISDTATVIYKKEILLNYNAIRNLIIQIYCNFDWLGGLKDGFAGANVKADKCWKENQTTLFYFVEGPELDVIQGLKKEIRDLYQIGNDSVHITDNNSETIQVASLILNDNSVDLMMKGCPEKYKNFNILIEEFKQNVLSAGCSLNDFVIDSSGVLALYGLREANDLDYLSTIEINSENRKIDNHNDYLKYHSFPLDDLLYDPRNYLYYNGIKFISLKCAREFKANRGEQKDLLDVKLIDSVSSGKINVTIWAEKLLFNLKRYSIFYYHNFKMKLKKNKHIGPFYNWLKKMIKR